ncbi:histidine kinase [Streptomyces sp. NPDC051172]|uniref:histidine kinase n=1 Tax=Streptomyces sp. NPDC051172 TaxID=3155796 RepID=UPI00343315D4
MGVRRGRSDGRRPPQRILEEARRRVAEERMRIARDLRDVVAHHLVPADLQAGAVAEQLPGRPGEALRFASDLSGTTA